MPAAALTTISSFKMIFFCENTITFFGQVKITFFNGQYLFHSCKITGLLLIKYYAIDQNPGNYLRSL